MNFRNSIAKIYEAGLLGGKSLAVDPKFDGADLAQSGDTLQSAIAPGLSELVNDKLTPLQEKERDDHACRLCFDCLLFGFRS